jgi:hypothetical protein
MRRAFSHGRDEAMNRKEALHALVDGKMVKVPGHEEAVLTMAPEGRIRNQCGSEYRLPNRDSGWELYEPPNPYPKGTFDWARWEANRGAKVRRAVSECTFVASMFTHDSSWALEHVDATDWEIA